MLLGDLGADVIKVERPGGEDARHITPGPDGRSLYTDWFNRNKRAVALDLRSQDGVDVLIAMLRTADVLVENFRPGTLASMGLAPTRLEELNPRLVVTSVSGFGQDGPWQGRAAFDSVVQAMSGLMSLTGTPETSPALAGFFAADHLAALYATIGTLAALSERERSGVGQRIDVALFDALVSCLGMTVPNYLANDEQYGPIGSTDRFTAPSQTFPTADGHVWVSAGSNKLFRALADVVQDGRLDEPRFSTPAGRVANRAELAEIVAVWTSTRTKAEVCSALDVSGVPYGPVSRIDEVLGSEYAAHRGLATLVPQGEGRVHVTPGMTIRLSATPTAVHRPPPEVGQHTDEILREVCGLGVQEIERLHAQKVVHG
jgi:crotonobetainyl-CoA:carnitine CoA-transferase CaiB-like acyl-CoA transferase